MSSAGADSIPARTLKAAILEDLETYEFDLTEPGLWVTATHRVRVWNERGRAAPRSAVGAPRRRRR